MAAAAAALLLLLLAFLPSAPAILDPVDYLALQSLRKSLYDLPGSTFLASWDFTADPCSSFSGVLCSASGRVTALALGDPRAGAPGLSGRLDASALSRLSTLSELSLVPGRVAGPIPSPLPSSLRFLALSNNLLSGRLPASLSLLLHLRTLDLSGNRLSGAIPPAILHLPRLSTLVLARNLLSGPLPATITSPLLRLDIKHNLLTGGVGHLPPTLNHLDLSFNRLSGEVRAGAEAAERVDLSHNRFTGAVPAGLAAATVVYLNDNRFTGEVPAVFAERVMAGAIRLLYLQRNYLTGIAGVGGGGAAEVPPGTALCLHYNCMVPPMAACPLRAGRRRTRPAAECPRWRKG